MRENILVTGGTGFTGGALCKKLASLGFHVRTIARSPEKAATLAAAGIEVIKGDLKDPASLKEGTEGCTTVYHIAAAYRQEGIPDREFREVNVEGARNILQAANKSGVKRFVHCSTVGVHGHIEHPPADENAPFHPGDIYQETKLEGEKLARRFFQENGLQGVVFRPTGIYGPGDMRFLKLFKHIKSGRFRMIGRGNVHYHLTYIDDLADGIILCGTRPEAVGNVYILGGDEYLTLGEMVNIIADILGAKVSGRHIPFWPVYAASFLCEKICRPFGFEPPLFRRRVDFFRKDRAFDISKARRELGYNPKVSVREGLRRTAAWYCEKGYI